MKRREFITLLGGAAAAWPLAARAQQPAKLPTIGFLGAATPSATGPWTAAFVQRLRELGWIEGRTVAIEYRWAEGRAERFAEIAAEFVRLKVDVIVTHWNRTGRRGKAGDIGHPDRLRDGGRPGRQRPGRESGATGRQRHRPVDPGHRSRWQATRTFARGCPRSPPVGDHGQCRQSRRRAGDGRGSGGRSHARPRSRPHSKSGEPEDIAPAFEALKGRADALYVVPDPLVFTNRIRINTLALGARLPTMHGVREFVEAGGLMSYGPNFPDLFRRAADYVDKILRGAKPADLPVEQPTKFDLVINLKTAKALGLDSAADAARPRRRGDRMKRREFITLLGGAAVAWPLAARAQQAERMRRIGVLMAAAPRTIRKRRPASRRSCRGCSNWAGPTAATCGSTTRWGAGDADSIRKYAAELVALAPDVILATGTATVAPLLQATRTVPIVFVIVADPVGAGFVDSLARPGGNATGFMQFEYSLSGKWLELLKQIAPGVTRAAVLRDPAITAGIGQFAVIQSVAPSVGVEVSPVNVRDAGEIERAVTAFARSPNGGLIVTASALAARSSRSDHHACGPAQAARGLLPTLLRHRRRPDLLWA